MRGISTSVAGVIVAGLLLPACGSNPGVDAGDPDATANKNSGVDLLGGGLGTPCDSPTPNAGPSDNIYDAQSLQCRSLLCVKPAVQPGVSETVSTTFYCTEQCVQDSDCVGQTRDPNDPLDTRCQAGFVCGIAFDIGPICCKKLCICKDFIAPSGLQTPASCMGDASVSCY
jgi:hypothetical protein